MLRKFYIQIVIIVFIFSSCVPASKVALKRTNSNLNELTKHTETLTEIVIKGFDLPPEVAKPLSKNIGIIATSTETETHANVGIFNFDSFVNGLVTLLEKAEPWLGIISKGLGLPAGTGEAIAGGLLLALGAYAKVKSSQTAKEKEQHEAELAKLNRKVQIVAMQDPEDHKKYKELEAKVDASNVVV